MIRICELSTDCDIDGDVQNILPILPQWRLQKALSYRQNIDRFLCAKSFLLLEEMLHKGFGFDRCPEFSYGEHGKPFFRDYPGIHFNISHCHKGIACAVSDSPVGIDIEVIQYDEDIAGAALNQEELAAVRASTEPDVKFTELWTLKESLLKLSGEGICENIKSVLRNATGVDFKTEIRRSAGYVCSIATVPGNEHREA